jgi:uncharacterized protein (DUF952 family)
MKNIFFTSFILTATLSANACLSHKEIKMEETNECPQYLYKILSLKNWQATDTMKAVQLSRDDDAFIHFSTLDQLERILNKFWPDAPEVVILKIDAQKLEGNLVFESNPGGINRYYHLYNGFIPINSIIDSCIIYPQIKQESDSQKLDVVQIRDIMTK